MISVDLERIAKWYAENSEKNLSGRYITLKTTEPLLNKLLAKKIGASVLGKPIYSYQIGSGRTKILVWSQMHGNESTGTKALFDLFCFFQNPVGFESLSAQILNNCQITFIPVLNPDGAEAYTRVNANEVDLNRDAVAISQPESKLLRAVLDEFKPKYCFNLHDQRTIFTVGDTKETATLSFLAPSVDASRAITEGRKETMRAIVAMNKLIQQVIPNKVGRYTDEFYPTATGDNFQKLGYNTILIEAGHYKGDYKREKVRYFNFLALLQGLNYISLPEKNATHEAYFDIPNNTSFYLDKIYTNIFLESENKKVDVGILYKEVLKDSYVEFQPTIKYIENLSQFNADSIEDKNELFFTDVRALEAFIKKIC